MDIKIDRPGWDQLSHQEKNRELFHQQKQTLDTLMDHGAITKAQHDKSLHDLMEKMGIKE